LADRQLEVAKETKGLAKASERSCVATNLEIIDANTAVFGAEAQELGARFKEAVAILELLSACGRPIPYAAGLRVELPNKSIGLPLSERLRRSKERHARTSCRLRCG